MFNDEHHAVYGTCMWCGYRFTHPKRAAGAVCSTHPSERYSRLWPIPFGEWTLNAG